MKNEVDNFAHLLTSIFSRLQPKAVMEWVVISWAIWSARNQFIFEKRRKPPDLIRDTGMDLLHHYHCASTVTGCNARFLCLYLGTSCLSFLNVLSSYDLLLPVSTNEDLIPGLMPLQFTFPRIIYLYSLLKFLIKKNQLMEHIHKSQVCLYS